MVISGANDVGYPQGHDVSRNVQRIETALEPLGGIPVVWTTISHNRPEWMAAWNQALRDVEARQCPNLHVCDWAAELALHPHYLEQDQRAHDGGAERWLRGDVGVHHRLRSRRRLSSRSASGAPGQHGRRHGAPGRELGIR